MIIKANIKMGISSLFAAKQRSILALLGIVIGIGSVIAMVSIGIIAKEESLRQFLQSGTDYVVMSKGWSYDSEGSTITEKMGRELVDRTDGLKLASMMGSSGASFRHRGSNYSGAIIASDQNLLDVNRLKLESGRFISDLDVDMPYVVLGSQIAADMVNQGVRAPIGERILMEGRLYTVIGVLEKSGTSSMRPFSPDSTVFLPISTYLRNFENAEISYITALMQQDYPTNKLTQNVKYYFQLRDPGLSIEVQTAEELIEQMNKQAQMFTILLGGVGGIALVVGGIGVMNVMLVSVAERKQEIGIRRALGALRRDIQFQFIIESLILCTMGGLIGIGLGIGASYFFANYNDYQFVVSEISIILGVGVSTGVGLFFGYYPAQQAANLDPIIALRS